MTAVPQEWLVGVFEGDPFPPNADAVRILSVEDRPFGTGTATRRFYVVLVRERPEAHSGIRHVRVLPLDDYETANLRAGLEVLRKLGLDTGDWLGQLLWKLPEVDQKPNCTVEDQLTRARPPAK